MPHDPLVFFTDRDLGRTFPDILIKAKLSAMRVERHSDHFAHDAPDEVWLKEVGRRGWFVLTRDQRIRYRPNEKSAIFDFTVGLFVLIGNARHKDLAENFIATYPAIEGFARNNERPFIAKIYRPSKSKPKGRVEKWLPD